METLKTYDEVISYLNSKKREHHLLMGNGFSISYDRDMFSYNALHRFIIDNRDEKVQQIFNVLNTQNFELVMQQLDNFADIAQVFDVSQNIIENVDVAVNGLRGGLIEAISSLHPQHVFLFQQIKVKLVQPFLVNILTMKDRYSRLTTIF